MSDKAVSVGVQLGALIAGMALISIGCDVDEVLKTVNKYVDVDFAQKKKQARKDMAVDTIQSQPFYGGRDE